MVDTDVDFVSLVNSAGKGVCGDTKALETKQFEGFFVKSIDTVNRRIEAIASTATRDRDGDIILPSAFKKTLPEYLKNPVILAAHCHRLNDGKSPVVAKTVKAWMTSTALNIVIEFAKTDLGEEYWHLYSNKYQRAFSIGFRGIKWRDENKNGVHTRIYTEVELFEISCVAVPSCPGALSKAKQRKLDFVTRKRLTRRGQNNLDCYDADRWGERLELWDDTPEDERSKIFTKAEFDEFAEFDRKGQEFAEALLSGEYDIYDNDDDDMHVDSIDDIDLIKLVNGGAIGAGTDYVSLVQ